SFLMILVAVMFAQNAALRRTALGMGEDQVVVLPIYSQLTPTDGTLFVDELRRLSRSGSVAPTQLRAVGGLIDVAPVAREPDATAIPGNAFLNAVGYDFFQTVGQELLAGRAQDREHGEDPVRFPLNGTPINIVIDDSLRRQLGFDSPRAAVGETI